MSHFLDRLQFFKKTKTGDAPKSQSKSQGTAPVLFAYDDGEKMADDESDGEKMADDEGDGEDMAEGEGGMDVGAICKAIRDGSISSTFVDPGAAEFLLPQLQNRADRPPTEGAAPPPPPSKRWRYHASGQSVARAVPLSRGTLLAGALVHL